MLLVLAHGPTNLHGMSNTAAHTVANDLAARFGADAPNLPTDVFTPQMAAMLARGTVRRYTDQVPSDALLQSLTTAAMSASSKSDFQQASLLQVKNTGIRAEIGKLFPSMPWIAQAPVFYVFLGDARRLEGIGALRSKLVDNSRLEGFFNATVDAALAMQTYILAAESAGLGCCPISVIRNRVDEVAALLNLPDLVFPVAGLCVGYPDAPARLSPRLPLAVTTHIDRYDDAALQAGVDAYDRFRDSRFPIRADQQRGNEKYGVAPFYGWSEDKVRAAMENEGTAFPIYLRTHGFSF
jgi:nitroreductase